MQKSYQSRLFQKSEIVFVQNRQFCQLPFLPARTIILAIDSNGAVGHLLTRSAVFVKKLFAVSGPQFGGGRQFRKGQTCLLYTSDDADE